MPSRSIISLLESCRNRQKFMICPFLLSVLLIGACSVKLNPDIQENSLAILPEEFVLVLQVEEDFVNDGEELLEIDSSQEGVNLPCSRRDMIDSLSKLALSLEGNIVKIEEEEHSRGTYDCDLLRARIYSVPDIRQHENLILWSKERRLSWIDFKGKAIVNRESIEAASSACSFGFKLIPFHGSLIVEISASFKTWDSWVLNYAQDQAGLLGHEQLHFDLAELYARKFRKRVSEIKLDRPNVAIRIQGTYNLLFADFLRKQTEYDLETKHGLNAEKQQQWARRIKEELSILETYAD